MGSKSCKMSSDKLEIKSPIFGCLLDHCTSSCMKDPEHDECTHTDVENPIPPNTEPSPLPTTNPQK